MARHVVLIEPDVDVLGEVAAQLRRRGFTVQLAEDIPSAVAKAETLPPDLFLIAGVLTKAPHWDEPLAARPRLASIRRLVLVKAPTSQGLPPGVLALSDIEGMVARALEVPRAPLVEDAARGDLRGDLQQLGLLDVLQLLSMNRRTGVLVLASTDGVAEIRLADGEVLDARFRRFDGEKALFRLVAIRTGTFVFSPSSLPAIARFSSPTSALLLEAMRQNDEAAELRVDLCPDDSAFVATEEPLDADDPPILHTVKAALMAPLGIDDLLDELPALDLDILQALSVLLDTRRVSRIGPSSGLAPLGSGDDVQMLRALASRLAQPGYIGPPTLFFASSPARLRAVARSLTRVVGTLAPVGVSHGSPVPAEMSRLRLGQGVELSLHGLPTIDAFAPLWALALSGAGAVLSLDAEVSPMLRAVAAALHVKVWVARELLPQFVEDDPVKVAQLIRLGIERSAS
jgi:hypothetical protein